MTLSIHHAAQRSESLPRQRVARLDLQCFLEAAYGVAVHLFSKVRAAQVVVRKVTRLVAAPSRGLFQPGNRFLEPAQLDQIRADVVVRVAELRIEPDGELAFRNGFFNAPLEMIGPAQEGMSLGRGMQLQRRLIQLDGAVVVAFHLCLISVLQNFPCSREGLHAHGHIVSTWSCKGQKYESPGRAGEEPVPCDGYGGRGTCRRGGNCSRKWRE